MALMTKIDQFRCSIAFQRDGVCPGNITKPDLMAAINAIDQWIEANKLSFNAALPLPFRTNVTVEQKAMLLAYVLWRKIGRLRVEEDR